MLLLDAHRLLNLQSEFEETGIQYCITYEVSPPSWEPFSSNIKTLGEAAPNGVDNNPFARGIGAARVVEPQHYAAA